MTDMKDMIELVRRRGRAGTAEDERKASELIRALERYGFDVLSEQDREWLNRD